MWSSSGTGECSSSVEKLPFLEIMVQARHDFLETKGVFQDGFQLSSRSQLSWRSSSYRYLYEIIDGLFKWIW